MILIDSATKQFVTASNGKYALTDNSNLAYVFDDINMNDSGDYEMICNIELALYDDGHLPADGMIEPLQ